MKERIKNEKGFTLVELLAVIVILGLLMAIAIPSVTKYITQSRKKTLISSVDSYVTAVTTAVNDNEFGALSKEDTMYYIPVSNEEDCSCVSLEKGGTDPFGNWKEAYVVVNYDADNYSYDYYFTFYDDAGYGMALTKVEDISASSNIITNPSPVDASNITSQKNDRASNIIVLSADSCDATTVYAATFADGTKMTWDELKTTYGVTDTKIPNSAFENADLVSIVIPEGVTSIGYYAFKDCTFLEDVRIPASVTLIGNYAFFGCSTLTKVYYKGTSSPTCSSNIFSRGEIVSLLVTTNYSGTNFCGHDVTKQ